MQIARERREAEQTSRVRVQYFEIAFCAIIMFILAVNIAAFSNKEADCGGFKVWLKVSLGIYLVDLIVALNQLMQIKKLHQQNLWLLLAMFIVVVINTCWLIYGNVIFWRNREECSDPDVAR